MVLGAICRLANAKSSIIHENNPDAACKDDIIESKDVGCRSNFDPSRPLYTLDTSFSVKSCLTAVRQGAKVPSSDIFDRKDGEKSRNSCFVNAYSILVLVLNLARKCKIPPAP